MTLFDQQMSTSEASELSCYLAKDAACVNCCELWSMTEGKADVVS